MVRSSTRKKRGGRGRGQASTSTISEAPVLPQPEEQESGENIVNDASPEPDPKKQKKDKILVVLTEEEENVMVEWLEANPILYNKKLKTYKDTSKKDTLWREKALEMGKDVIILKTWYTSLRTRYGRLRKFNSGQEAPDLTERDLWILRSFEFLKNHIIEVPKRTLVSVSFN